MNIPTVAALETEFAKRGWVVHNLPGRLNVAILRNEHGKLDAFDDMLVAWWYFVDPKTGQSGLTSELFACRCTADPGKVSLDNPKRKDGCAVMDVQQMVNGWFLGEHGPNTPKASPALRPVHPVKVLRYTSSTDTTGEPSTSSMTLIHRASATHESTVVGPWSEGCCVIANPDDHKQFILLCKTKEATSRYTVSILPWS